MSTSLDLRELWSELDDYEKELNEEAGNLEKAWTALCELDEENTTTYEALADAEELAFLPPGTLMKLNIGGQEFILTVEVLTKDPFSILASCCRIKAPFKTGAEEENSIYFDRDWWLFRHIVTFLRTGMLPNELDTLTELYTEASFYRLENLKRSIEDVPVAKLQPKLPVQFDRTK